jgi:hypothetical protein
MSRSVASSSPMLHSGWTRPNSSTHSISSELDHQNDPVIQAPNTQETNTPSGPGSEAPDTEDLHDSGPLPFAPSDQEHHYEHLISDANRPGDDGKSELDRFYPCLVQVGSQCISAPTMTKSSLTGDRSATGLFYRARMEAQDGVLARFSVQPSFRISQSRSRHINVNCGCINFCPPCSTFDYKHVQFGKISQTLSPFFPG